ncbi:hypothetical protein M0R04_12905 [Candidatus Dojkabacteria bacterium]|jgi:hypothetical protein|nr:hypothetical protein [Candidatus Dojkabacteria bacterium]
MLTPEKIEELKKKYKSDNTNLMPETEGLKGKELLNSIMGDRQDVFSEVKSKEKQNGFIETLKGVGKGVVNTLSDMGDAGEKLETGILRTILPKSAEKALGIAKEQRTEDYKYAGEDLFPEESRTASNAWQKLGFTGEQIAEFFIPITKVNKVSSIGKVGKALIGAFEMAGKTAIQTGGDIGATAGAGITDLALTSVGGVLGKTLFKSLPKSITQNVLKQKTGEKDVTEFLLEKSKIGTPEQIINNSKKVISELDDKVTGLLNSVKITTDKVTAKSILQNTVDKINEAGGKTTIEEIKKIINNLAPQARGLLDKQSWSLTNANQLRRVLDKTLTDKAFLSQQLPYNKSVLMDFANTIRNTVKEKAPQEVRSLFEEMSKEITLSKALQRTYGGTKKGAGIGLKDLMALAGGGAAGGAVGSALTLSALKASENPAIKLQFAQKLYKLDKLAEKVRPILEKLKPAEQGIISQMIQALTDEID